MDSSDWNVFSQLLRQTGGTKKVDAGSNSAFDTVEDHQFKSVPISQAVYTLDTLGLAAVVSGQYTLQLSTDSSAVVQDSSVSYSTSDVNTLFQGKAGAQNNTRQSGIPLLNGSMRQSVETNVVKSLLTGQQYIQSNTNSQLSRSGANASQQGLNKSSTTMQNYDAIGNQKVSLLQPGWQQQNELDTGGLEIKTEDAMQQMICSDSLPENVAPGEKVYVYVDGVAYEIIAGSNQELMAQPAAGSGFSMPTGMSLEDLANVSAEQESLKPADFQTSVTEGGLTDAAGNMINQAQLGLELLHGAALQDIPQPVDGQHYLQLQQSQPCAGIATSEQEGMQIIIMQAEDNAKGQKPGTQTSGGGDLMKLGVQDFLLQTRQSLPPEIQEMVARGIDLSNCEFVIQDEDDMQHNPGVYLSSADGTQFQGTISTDLQQQLASVMNSSAIFANPVTSQTGFGDVLQPITLMNTSIGVGDLPNVNSNNVLALLASTAVANREHQGASSDLSGMQSRVSAMQMIAPEDEDDGEFAYLVMDQQGDSDEQTLANRLPQPHPCDAFLSAFLGFIQGNKPETLSSVANSTILKKPPLPAYDPDLCRRPVQTVKQQVSADVSSCFSQKPKPNKAPVTVSLVFTDPSGPSLVSVGGNSFGDASLGTAEAVKQISVTPFIVQKIDGKSVVLPGSEMQKYLPKTTSDKGRPLASDYGSGQSIREMADKQTKEKLSKIIKRKLRGSDDDSFDDSDTELGTISCMSDSDSDPAWKPTSEESWLKKYGCPQLEAAKPIRGRGRGRGRPRTTGRGAGRATALPNAVSADANSATVGYILQVGSDNDSGLGLSAPVNPTDAHNYQKEDFVIERKDMYRHEGFPIWKIEAGRLLQKYDPVESNVGLVHKSASVYSSWSGDIRTNFKAIMVELVNTSGRRFETVRVLNEYMPQPSDDSLEQDAVMELFNIYVQDIVSQALDQMFLTAIMDQQEEYYLGPLRQIDGLLQEAKQTILNQITWTEKFKVAMNQCPYFQLTDASSQMVEQMHCQATSDSSCPAVKSVKFFGPTYNENLLQVTGEIEKTNAETFYVGQAAVDHLTIYHALHHYKFLLFKKCEEEVQYLKLKNDKTDEVVLGECLQNRVFVQQCLRQLKQLLEKCSIIITVVTKPEEEEMEEEMNTQ